jgi:hypothetical protein
MRCPDCHVPMVPSNDLGNIKGYVHRHRFAVADFSTMTETDARISC